jgi:hypothetical protein
MNGRITRREKGWALLWLVSLMAGPAILQAGEVNNALGARSQKGEDPAGSGASSTNAWTKRLPGNRVQIGQVIVDPASREVTFPTVVNMTNGMVEYFLVTEAGKVHESVLRTMVEPFQIHTALLLLGAVPATNVHPADFHDPSKNIPGERVTILTSWTNGTTLHHQPASELIHNQQTGAAMTRGPWAFNGSMMVDGHFVAQREGSIVAIMSDPYALLSNPRRGRENDEIWFANTNTVPALGTPVALTIRLERALDRQK